MSRNLCQMNCNDCPAPRVALVERPRHITEADAGRYFREFAGLLVANAECPLCHAKYLAWVDETGRAPYQMNGYVHVFDRCPSEYGVDYFDLSYRAAFNDEPAPDDLPTHDVEIAYVCTPREAADAR